MAVVASLCLLFAAVAVPVSSIVVKEKGFAPVGGGLQLISNGQLVAIVPMPQVFEDSVITKHIANQGES